MAGASITTFPVQFWQWWLQELQSLAPPADQRKLANRRTRREIFVGGGSVSLHEKQRLSAPLHSPTLIAPAANLPDLLAKAKRLGPVILSFGSDEYFVRRSVLPVQALPRAQQILDLELRQVLPLASSDVFTSWYQAGPQKLGQATLVQIAIKRSRAEELVATLREAGAKTAAISFRDPSGSALSVAMDVQGKTLGASANRMWQKMTVALFIMALAILAAFIWLAFSRQETEMAAIAVANDEMRAKAVEVRQLIDSAKMEDARVAKLVKLRADAPSLVAVWDNLARILPDSAWISTFALNDNTVSLDGEAADAEGLLKLLEASKSFKNVRFTAPVTKNPGADRSHYAIAMDFEDLS